MAATAAGGPPKPSRERALKADSATGGGCARARLAAPNAAGPSRTGGAERFASLAKRTAPSLSANPAGRAAERGEEEAGSEVGGRHAGEAGGGSSAAEELTWRQGGLSRTGSWKGGQERGRHGNGAGPAVGGGRARGEGADGAARCAGRRAASADDSPDATRRVRWPETASRARRAAARRCLAFRPGKALWGPEPEQSNFEQRRVARSGGRPVGEGRGRKAQPRLAPPRVCRVSAVLRALAGDGGWPMAASPAPAAGEGANQLLRPGLPPAQGLLSGLGAPDVSARGPGPCLGGGLTRSRPWSQVSGGARLD